MPWRIVPVGFGGMEVSGWDWDEGLIGGEKLWSRERRRMVGGIDGRRTVFELNGYGFVCAFHEKSERVVSVRG